jgi:hypothetical protein
MDNPDKRATNVTHDDEKHTKDATHYVLDTTMRTQTQLT